MELAGIQESPIFRTSLAFGLVFSYLLRAKLLRADLLRGSSSHLPVILLHLNPAASTWKEEERIKARSRFVFQISFAAELKLSKESRNLGSVWFFNQNS